MADTPTLVTLPTEILCMIGSNLGGKDLGNVAQVSKRVRQVFLPRLFKTIRLYGTMRWLNKQLTSLLRGRSTSLMESIQPIVRYAVLRIQGISPPGLCSPRLSESLIALINEFLQRIPLLKGVAFYITFKSRAQQTEFNKLLRKTQKWSAPRSLRFVDDVGPSALNAIVRHYVPGTLEAVQLSAWHNSQKYHLLRSLCPTLKALHLTRSAYELRINVFRCMDHEILNSINRDFPQMESLVLHEETHGQLMGRYGDSMEPEELNQLNQKIERLIVSLNAMPHLRRFAFTLWRRRLALGSEIDAELDDWYSTLILRISNAVPRLEELCIMSRDFYRGKRINGQSVMTVEQGSFKEVGEKYLFPSVLVI